MGGGHWEDKIYFKSREVRASAAIPDFAYSTSTMKSKRDFWKAHENLDPSKITRTISGVRESRDSKEHPDTRAIFVCFDETGSMRRTPLIFQKKLTTLMSFILMKTGLEHPQILISAIGDATCDRVPVQISQFESDNRIDEHLRNLFLEGGGGDGQHESYELMLYAAARLTTIDCYEKRGKKGYLFIIGDEVSYTKVKKDEVEKIFGIKEQSDIPLEDIIAECAEKYNVYFIMPSGTAHWDKPEIRNFWLQYLDQNFRTLENPGDIAELLATIISMNEGADIESITKELQVIGANESTISVIKKSVAGYTATKNLSKGVIPSTKSSKDVIKL